MYEEQRLIMIGFPLDDAINICHSMRKDGSLETFVEEQEQIYKSKCAHFVKEVID